MARAHAGCCVGFVGVLIRWVWGGLLPLPIIPIHDVPTVGTAIVVAAATTTTASATSGEREREKGSNKDDEQAS